MVQPVRSSSMNRLTASDNASHKNPKWVTTIGQRARRRRLQPEVEALPDRRPAAAARRPSAPPARLRRARTPDARSRASRAIRLHDLHGPRPEAVFTVRTYATNPHPTDPD